MSIKISSLPTANTIDGSADWLAIVTTSLTTTQKISRNTLLGITGSPLGNTDSQTISNKTLDNTNVATIKDGNLTLQSSGGVTKQAQFVLSSITGGQTRTVTLPDANITVVGTATTQTLTNKTLTAPTITSPSVTGTVSGAATYSSPTLTTPTIADFSNANHTHLGATTGGLLTYAAIATTAGSAWTTFSPTPLGFSALTTQTGQYIQIGKLIIMEVFIQGTSNATTLTFTLPVNFKNDASYTWVGARVTDNSVVKTTAGAIAFASGATTADCWIDPSFGTSWTASGTKAFQATAIIYQAA